MDNLRTTQKASIIELINEIFSKGEFICPIKTEVTNEIVLTVLNDYEKAIYLTAEQVADEHNDYCTLFDEHDIKPDYKHCSLSIQAYNALMGLLWVSVRTRLQEGDFNIIELKSNWQIVGYQLSEEEIIRSRFEESILSLMFE